MKRFISIGLAAVTLALVAAQCGAAVQSATDSPAKQAGEEAPAAEAAPEESAVETAAETALNTDEEVVAEEPVTENNQETVEESSPVEEPVAESEAEAVEAEAVEEETMAEVSVHTEANCDDPFADAGSLRFSPQVWTAESISRFVGPHLVDPESGLETNFCLHSVDYSEILSGGPPPDGIPPIDNPTFDSIADTDEWLADVQPVIALAVGDEAKAYPLAILTRHEIANDEIAGMPVAVTFCPLCNAAVVFNREVNGDVLRFGVSGNLRNSDLVMWDNKSLSWWQQFTGEAIVGEMTGTQLEMIPAQLVAWKDFKAAYPDGVALSANGRNYGSNPYVGYDSSTQPFLFLGTPDSRLPATERVLGYFTGKTAVAYPMPVIAEEKVIADNLDGRDVVIFYEPGQVSALDKGTIEDSKEIGSAGMFIPEVDGQTLTFTYAGSRLSY